MVPTMKVQVTEQSILTMQAWQLAVRIAIILLKDDHGEKGLRTLERANARALRRQAKDPVKEVEICCCPDCSGF